MRKSRNYISGSLVTIYLAAATAAYAAFAFIERTRKLDRWNKQMTKKLQRKRRRPLDLAMQVPSKIGSGPPMYILAGALLSILYRKGRTRELLVGLYALAACTLLDAGVKRIVSMPRPARRTVFVHRKKQDPSQPSGHTLMFTGFFGYFGWLALGALGARPQRAGLAALFLLGLVFIGVSRVYLGEHWTTDVIGGYVLGSEVLVTAVYLKGGRMKAEGRTLAPRPAAVNPGRVLPEP